MLDAARKDEDWKTVAMPNCVSLITAYGWIRRYNVEKVPKQRGGARNKKLTQLHIDTILRYIETDHLITLDTIKQYILSISISTTTCNSQPFGLPILFSKKAQPQPATMNSDENKPKRSQYVSSLMYFVGLGKYVIYIDESDCNLFLRRSFER